MTMAFPGVAPQWLDQYVQVQASGITVTQRHALNFLGAGVTVTDNPANDSTDVTIGGGGSSVTWAGDLAGSNNTTQVVAALSGASGTTTLKSNLFPDTDATRSIGAASTRISFVTANNFAVYHANTDTQASALLTDGAIKFGAGGSTAASARFQWISTGVVTFDDAAGGNSVQLNIGAGAGGTLNTGIVFANVGAATGNYSGTAMVQQGTGPANGTSASYTINTQAPSATNGTPGNVVAAFSAPTGTGTEAYLGVQRAGLLQAAIGQLAGGSYAALWLGPGLSKGTTNYAINSDGANYTALNSPTYLRFQIGAGDYGSLTTAGMTIGNLNSAFGGGTGQGMLALVNCAGPPTGPQAGLCILFEDTIGLHHVGPSNSFLDYMIAPVQQGTVNSQQNKVRQYSGPARTTSTAAVTIMTIPLSTSGSVAGLFVMVNGRVVSGGTVGDSICISQTVSFKNVSGTVTAATAQAAQQKAADTSLNTTPTLIYTISGTNILIQVTGIASVTIDWLGVAEAMIN